MTGWSPIHSPVICQTFPSRKLSDLQFTDKDIDVRSARQVFTTRRSPIAAGTAIGGNKSGAVEIQVGIAIPLSRFAQARCHGSTKSRTSASFVLIDGDDVPGNGHRFSVA